MAIRLTAFLFIIGVAVLAYVAWPRGQAHPPPPSAPAPTEAAGGAMPGLPDTGTEVAPEPLDPGLEWTVPARWTVQGERPMRLATYSVPRVKGDAEDGECAVFYFGPNQGGGVEDNIDRWIGQFENPSTPLRSTRTVRGLSIARVRMHGAYLAPGGPHMESQGKKPDFMLMGAIVTGPQGAVFFKLIGPAKTVGAAAAEFDRMIAGLTIPPPR